MDATADAQGDFVLGPMRPGHWRVVAMPCRPSSTYTELVVGAPSEGVAIHLEPGRTLAGRVVGDDVARFEVHWALPPGPEGPRVGTVSADEAGAFRIPQMPALPVRLFARRIGDPRYGLLEDALPGPDEVHVVLRLGKTIEGECGDYQGRVIAHQGDLQHEGRADRGTFRIAGLPDGLWTLRRVARSEGEGVTIEWEVGPDTAAEAGRTGVRLR